MAERKGDMRRRVLDALTPYLVLAAVAVGPVIQVFWTLRKPGVQLSQPWALLLLAAVPLLCFASFHGRRGATVRYSRTSDLASTSQGLMGRLVNLPASLRITACALIAVSLAGPEKTAAERAEQKGIDIVLVLDVSGSMAEKDLLPDRLEAAKRVLDEFIQKRQHDRIGLVLFGTQAFLQAPLTYDHRTLRMFLASTNLRQIDGRSTAIGNAVGSAINRLRDPDCEKKKDPVEQRRCKELLDENRATSKVIVLVTDGDDNASQMDPHTAAQLAAKLGIRVFTILIGRDVARSPGATDRYGNPVGPAPRYAVNPRLLDEIASVTGGTSYLATDTDALNNRFHSIVDELQKSPRKSQRVIPTPLYPLFIAPALALLLLELALSLTRFRRFP
jgi:Ca-activated chloride channel family protein